MKSQVKESKSNVLLEVKGNYEITQIKDGDLTEKVRSGITKVRSLIRGILPKDKRVRVIISGGYQDSWGVHYLDVDRYEIPQGTPRVYAGCVLDLVVQRGEDGRFYEVRETHSNNEPLKLSYCFLARIPRVTTLITEDGRVFHDRSLLRSKDNSDRLADLLKTLADEYGSKGSFESQYLQIEKGRV
ncbi:hypothetical protein HYT56_03810 [Candidatus Woesearchaeota archaeon]|nr:hypothetical protein [Candidatus Woesearchaeota archaeon]